MAVGLRHALGRAHDTSMLFTRRQKTQREDRLKTILSAVVTTTPISVQKVRLVASEAGEGRTRLTVVGSRRQGERSEKSGHSSRARAVDREGVRRHILATLGFLEDQKRSKGGSPAGCNGLSK